MPSGVFYSSALGGIQNGLSGIGSWIIGIDASRAVPVDTENQVRTTSELILRRVA